MDKNANMVVEIFEYGFQEVFKMLQREFPSVSIYRDVDSLATVKRIGIAVNIGKPVGIVLEIGRRNGKQPAGIGMRTG